LASLPAQRSDADDPHSPRPWRWRSVTRNCPRGSRKQQKFDALSAAAAAVRAVVRLKKEILGPWEKSKSSNELAVLPGGGICFRQFAVSWAMAARLRFFGIAVFWKQPARGALFADYPPKWFMRGQRRESCGCFDKDMKAGRHLARGASRRK